jgi:hypothetical protein
MTTLTSLKAVLPQVTLDAWGPVAAVTPPGGILMGDTALTCHLHHRDYFDLMEIEVQANRFVEEGLQLYMDRYLVAPSHASIGHILKGFGYFDDLIDDPQLERERCPDLMSKVISYWTRRQPHLLASFDPYATSPPPWPPAPPG